MKTVLAPIAGYLKALAGRLRSHPEELDGVHPERRQWADEAKARGSLDGTGNRGIQGMGGGV